MILQLGHKTWLPVSNRSFVIRLAIITITNKLYAIIIVKNVYRLILIFISPSEYYFTYNIAVNISVEDDIFEVVYLALDKVRIIHVEH